MSDDDDPTDEEDRAPFWFETEAAAGAAGSDPAPALLRQLVDAIAAAPFHERAVRGAITELLGPRADPFAWRIAEALTRRRVEADDPPVLSRPYRNASLLYAPCLYAPRPARLAKAIWALDAFHDLAAAHWASRIPAPDEDLDPRAMTPAAPFARLPLPAWATEAALAYALGLTPEELDWFSDVDGRSARSTNPTLRHYRARRIPKASGGRRLIEAPRPRLKAIQRQLLRQILDLVPAHSDAIGYVRGRSAVEGAARHAREAVVLSFDLRRFFQSIPSRRAHAVFRCLGYPYGVARRLTGLTTCRTFHLDDDNAEDPGDWADGVDLRAPHLPQGAPTSPALANLCAWRLDRRLSGLARRLDASYSRYADDLAFSGDAGLGARWVRDLVDEIVREEGFRLAPEKTRVQLAGGRQMVTGVVVNQHVNLRRRDYDQLKAILTNCARRGPATENRADHPAFREHLDGRIGWVEQLNPRRAAKLRAIFDRIEW